ncbi:MAG: hypothetical protein AAF926_00235 [Pseudomonadota bacterium]
MTSSPHNAVSDAMAAEPVAMEATLHRSATGPNGDDLTRARLFCLAAGSEMTAIIEADRSDSGQRTPHGRDPVWICERLDRIQRHAKRARARAIYRSAQDVMALIERSHTHLPIDWTRVDGRLFVLNKLLGQYEAGLDELMPKNGFAAASDPVPGRQPIEQSYDISKATLSTMLPHASQDERAALTRLMDLDLSHGADTTTQPEEVTQDKPSHPDMLIDAEPIDFMLPALMQRLLEVGQQYGKVLSLSHSLDTVWIVKSEQSAVEACLYDRLSELIAGSLPLQGVGRLDIGAAAKGFEISGSGFDTFTLLLPDGALATPLTASESAARDETPKRAPMITDDTETALREQLSSLMDGGLGKPEASPDDLSEESTS